MRTEKDFKQKISEIAANIAENQPDIGKSRKRPEPSPFRNIKYSGIKLSPGMEKQAMDVVSSLSADARDEVKAVSLTKKRFSGPDSRPVSIVFKVDFKQMESFVGVVEIPESDLYKQSSDPDDPGSISLKPGANLPPVDQYGNVVRGKKGKPYKAATSPSTGYSPVSVSSKSSDPRKKFDYLREMVRDNPKITAMFVNPSGKSRNLADANFLSSKTKDAVMKFLNNLSVDELKEEEKDTKETIKNKKDFKQKISEIAAKIAEGVYEEDEAKKPIEVDEANDDVAADAVNFIKKVEALRTSLEPVTKLINSSKELADVLLKLIDIMPNLPAGADVQGLNKALTVIKQKSTPSNDVPDVSPADKKEMGLDMKGLQEAFNRINRK